MIQVRVKLLKDGPEYDVYQTGSQCQMFCQKLFLLFLFFAKVSVLMDRASIPMAKLYILETQREVTCYD